MNRNALALLAILGATGCSTEETTSGPADPPRACDARFEETKVDGSCGTVTVTGIAVEEVSFISADKTFRGQLVLPVTDGTYAPPTIVLAHGSGPHGIEGRVDGVLGVPLGEDLDVYTSFAEQLAWRGIASLRYEKRSCFREVVSECTSSIDDYPGDLMAITVDDFVEDARQAVLSLGDRDDLRPNDIVFAGHSQGGSFVPHLVASEASVTGGIGLAAPGMSLLETLPGQIEAYADHLESLDATRFQEDIANLRQTAAQYRTELGQVLDGSWPQATFLGASVGFWQSFANWTDRALGDLATTTEPLLYIGGDSDFNVGPPHLAAYASWIEANELAHVETTELPNLTHALIEITAGTPPIDHQIQPEVSPALIDRIDRWMRSRP